MTLLRILTITVTAALSLALVACAPSPVITMPGLATRENTAAINTPDVAAQENTVATNTPELATQEMATPTADIVVQDMLREDNQGAVTVSVTPLSLDGTGDTLDFNIAMNTHSVDLSMDLAIFATLETDIGLSVVPIIWDAPRGGHHVGGTLSFPANMDGKSLLADAKMLKLIIRDVDVPERVFTWKLEN